MNIVLFDDASVWKNFLPLTFTRPVSEIRIGILTIKEKWEKSLGRPCSYHTQAYLSGKYPSVAAPGSVFIQSNFCPNPPLVEAIRQLKTHQALYKNNRLISFRADAMNLNEVAAYEKIAFDLPLFEIGQLWEIFQKNEEAISADFDLLTANRISGELSQSVTVIGNRQLVFLEEGARAEACILNTTAGPVYIGKNAEVMEGAVVRGPFALCEHSVLKMGAKIYGATTIGPHSKVGGEVSNSVIFGYSNKAHDGFVGNSVIGEWCNLGADTNTSNLKNNYGNVKLFSYSQNKPIDTGLQFCGLMMADHSKAGINTMFNTGTVVGVGCNIYGGNFPPTAIPSFSWGGSEGFVTYDFDKFLFTAQKIYERRGLTLSPADQTVLHAIFEQTVSS